MNNRTVQIWLLVQIPQEDGWGGYWWRNFLPENTTNWSWDNEDKTGTAWSHVVSFKACYLWTIIAPLLVLLDTLTWLNTSLCTGLHWTFGNKLLGVWPFANFKWRSVTSPLIFLFLCDESWKKVLCTYTHSYTHELQIYQGCKFSYKSSTGITNFKVTTLALGFTDGEAYSWLLFPTQQNGVGGKYGLK